MPDQLTDRARKAAEKIAVATTDASLKDHPDFPEWIEMKVKIFTAIIEREMEGYIAD